MLLSSMASTSPRERPRDLVIDLRNHRSELRTDVHKALGSETRLRILELLTGRIFNVSEIARSLDIPFSTANMHVNVLEEAGLILVEHKPGKRGAQKVCARVYNRIIVQLTPAHLPEGGHVRASMPIGHYTDCVVEPTCGMISETGVLAPFDDPVAFYEPIRTKAQMLWFGHGHVEYRFPNRVPRGATLEGVQLSLELCSEAPRHHPDWPSDITLWINGVEIGTWTSPADFGGQRGAHTPVWWDLHNTQFGLLKLWQVNASGSFVDGERVSSRTITDLDVAARRSVVVRIGVKDDAHHRGGVTLFGEAFGNHAQDIELGLLYKLE